jgi:hypothetical protein
MKILFTLFLWFVFFYANYQMTVNRFRLKSFAASMVLLAAVVAIFFDALYLTVQQFPR